MLLTQGEIDLIYSALGGCHESELPLGLSMLNCSSVWGRHYRVATFTDVSNFRKDNSRVTEVEKEAGIWTFWRGES